MALAAQRLIAHAVIGKAKIKKNINYTKDHEYYYTALHGRVGSVQNHLQTDCIHIESGTVAAGTLAKPKGCSWLLCQVSCYCLSRAVPVFIGV